VHPARQRPLANRSNLEDDVSDKTSDAEWDVVERNGVRRGDDQLDPARDLRRECADECEKEQPEGERRHFRFQTSDFRLILDFKSKFPESNLKSEI
jgi:hypothetical protein